MWQAVHLGRGDAVSVPPTPFRPWRLTDRLRLRPGEVHVWRILLSDRTPAVAWAALTDTERDHAASVVPQGSRARFATTRGVLRLLLATCTGVPTSELRLTAEPGGRPVVAHPGVEVDFNVSHTHGVALCAVTGGLRVGVDVERIVRRPRSERVAQRVLSPSELRDLQALPSAERPEGFLRLWTRKEAVAKADGRGDRLVYRHIEVGGPGPVSVEGVHYHLRDLDVGEGALAALATTAPPAALMCWEWPVADEHAPSTPDQPRSRGTAPPASPPSDPA
jgi:4'-phosphopantetheinyl transferase